MNIDKITEMQPSEIQETFRFDKNNGHLYEYDCNCKVYFLIGAHKSCGDLLEAVLFHYSQK